MVTHNEALAEYISIIQSCHKLNLNYLNRLMLLPAIKCRSYNLTTESENTLLNVYHLNGFMLNRFVIFYQEYVIELKQLAKKYCKKNKLNYAHYKETIEDLNNSGQRIIEDLNVKLETVSELQDDIEFISHNIKEMYKSIDDLVNLEFQISSIVNLDKVDVVGKKMFSLFRRNELHTMTKLLLIEFPKSSILTLKKRYFIHKLNELDNLIESSKD